MLDGNMDSFFHFCKDISTVLKCTGYITAYLILAEQPQTRGQILVGSHELTPLLSLKGRRDKRKEGRIRGKDRGKGEA